jgi:hypothetical protein
MRQTIPADRQDHVATGVIVKACNPGSGRSQPGAAGWVAVC